MSRYINKVPKDRQQWVGDKAKRKNEREKREGEAHARFTRARITNADQLCDVVPWL